MTEVVKTLMMMFTPEFLSTSTTQPKFFFFFRFPDSLYSPLCCFFESIFPLCLGLDRRKRTCAVTVDGRKKRKGELDQFHLMPTCQPTNKRASR